jgi:hypothetical protein
MESIANELTKLEQIGSLLEELSERANNLHGFIKHYWFAIKEES